MFELFILRVLSALFAIQVLIFLLRGHWMVALMMAVCCFFIGAIGQGLPHRKAQTVPKLMRGDIPEPESPNELLSDQDAFVITKATMQAGIVVALAALAITWSRYPWYWNLVAMAVGFGLTAIVSFGSLFIYAAVKRRAVRSSNRVDVLST